MYTVSLVMAIVLMAVALTGRKGRLAALAMAWMAVFPAIMPLGMRSTIFASEMVVAISLIPWLLRSKARELPGAPGWFPAHILVLVAWVPIPTTIGLLVLERYTEVTYRVPMATLRMAAPLLSFAIPASATLSKEDFNFVLRVLRFAFLVFLVVALIDYMRLLPVQFYFQARDIGADVIQLGQAGYINRATLGSVAVLGIFVCLLSVQLRQGLRPLSLAGLVGFVSLVLLCQSRSSLLAMIGFAFSLMIMHRGNRIRNTLLVSVGFITVYLVISHTPFVAERLETMTTAEAAMRTSGRIVGWKKAVSFLIAGPVTAFTGVGYDLWSARIGRVCGLANGHNVYLHAWGELGLLGGGLFIAIFVRLAWQYFLAMRCPGDGRIIAGTALSLVAALAVSNMTIVGVYPAMGRLISVHATMFIFGLMFARLRYIIAEQQLLTAHGGVPHQQRGAHLAHMNSSAGTAGVRGVVGRT